MVIISNYRVFCENFNLKLIISAFHIIVDYRKGILIKDRCNRWMRASKTCNVKLRGNSRKYL